MQSLRPVSIHDDRYKKSIEILVRSRKAVGMSQSDLAVKVGFTQPDISKIERLERRLDITEFFDILNAISGSDRSKFDQIWKEIYECHSGRKGSRKES